MSNFPFLLNAQAADPQQSLLDSFTSSGMGIIPTEVRGDKMWAIQITPVIPDPNGEFTWVYDGLDSDIYRLSIGLRDTAPTSGASALLLNATAFALSYSTTEAAAQTAIQAASTAAAYGTVTVTKTVNGSFILQWAANGAVPVITESSNTFLPPSVADIRVLSAGSVSTKAKQSIEFLQQPVVYAEPNTLLPVAGVTNSTIQAPTASLSAIRKITFDAPGTYGGTFSVVVVANGVSENVGQGYPTMTAEAFGLLLANHSQINFQASDGTADNIVVTNPGSNFQVGFIGTLGATANNFTITTSTAANPTVVTTSATHNITTGDNVTISGSSNGVINTTATATATGANTFTVPNAGAAAGTGGNVYNVTKNGNNVTATNIDLAAPKGVSGFVNFSTENLWIAFQNTTEDSLDYTLEIERERASGEIRTLLQVSITLLRDLITGSALVPLPPSGTVNVGSEFRIISSANGGTMQVSADDGATWETFAVYTHS